MYTLYALQLCQGSASTSFRRAVEKAKRRSKLGQHCDSGLVATVMSTVSEHDPSSVPEAASSKRERVKSLLGLKKEKSHSESHNATGGPSPRPPARPTPSISEERDPPPCSGELREEQRQEVDTLGSHGFGEERIRLQFLITSRICTGWRTYLYAVYCTRTVEIITVQLSVITFSI